MTRTATVLARCLTGALLLAALLVLPHQTANAANASEDEAEKARKLLTQFLAPNADYIGLTQKLMPGRMEYQAYFGQAAAGRAAEFYDGYWQSGQIVIRPRAGQTELTLLVLDLADLKAGKPLPAGFPPEYDKLRDKLRGAKAVYAFKFVKPGESTGIAWDGLARLGGRWVFFPLPWKALGE